MKKTVLGLGAAVFALTVTACSDSPTENNLAPEEINSVSSPEELPENEASANVAVDESATSEPEAVPTNPAPAKSLPTAEKPKAAPAPAKPAPAPVTEQEAADPSCAPEHRAAGHC